MNTILKKADNNKCWKATLENNLGWAPVAHTCNPSYSRGRDQEDCGLKPAQAIVHETLSQKNPSQKGLVEWLKVKALSSSPSTAKKIHIYKYKKIRKTIW
jgi:hypothetical protein